MSDFKKKSFGKKPFGSKPFGARAGFGAKRFGARSFDAPTEFFKAECNECHKECEVPFRPNGKKPVYCRDCFQNQERDDAPVRSSSRYAEPMRSAPRFTESRSAAPDLTKQFNVLATKLDRLTAAIEAQTRVLEGTKE